MTLRCPGHGVDHLHELMRDVRVGAYRPAMSEQRVAFATAIEPHARLTVANDGLTIAADVLDRAVGSRFAMKIRHLRTPLDRPAGAPMLVADPDDSRVAAVQMPCSWQ